MEFWSSKHERTNEALTLWIRSTRTLGRRQTVSRKQGGLPKESRRSRLETSFQIRKARKDASLMARRRMVRRVVGVPVADSTNKKVEEATTQLRRLLVSHENNAVVVDLVLRANVLPFLVAFLSPKYSSLSTLQIESAWVLGCIGSSRTKDVAESGAVAHLVRLLATSDIPELREKAAWCISNIAEESIEYRDRLLAMQDLIGGL